MFASILSRDEGQLLKQRICSSSSKFIPLTVDPILQSYFNKQEFLQINNIKLFFKKKLMAFIRAGVFISINIYISLQMWQVSIIDLPPFQSWTRAVTVKPKHLR